jgi:hypothetical protein
MKKNLVVLGAVALTAAAVPALAFENEFHGSFTVGGFISNAYNSGTGALILGDNAGTNNFIDQRARLQYIAKASDDLKLVTQFELDTKWGGRTGGKYTNSSDAGGLDADGINLETKHVYLDFNLPAAPLNVKLGILPWADAYKGTFGIVDDTAAVLTGKFGKATATLAGVRVADAAGASGSGAVDGTVAGKSTVDLIVVDGKFAINKDMTVGANYYALLRDTGAVGGTTGVAEFTNTVGVNFAGKFGPAAVDAWGGYQFGDYSETAGQDLKAYSFGATAKIKAGPGTASVAALYLSGEDDGSGDISAWQAISANTSYFNDANMWLLIRNPLSMNTSAALGGNDLTKGGRGLMGLFAGYNGAQNKLLYGANVGYAQVAEERSGEDGYLGTEVNAMVGYKLYDNLTVKFNAAYALLGDGGKAPIGNGGIYNSGSTDVDNPWVTNLLFQYVF